MSGDNILFAQYIFVFCIAGLSKNRKSSCTLYTAMSLGYVMTVRLDDRAFILTDKEHVLFTWGKQNSTH